MRHSLRSGFKRVGVTLIEVIFSIGVVLIGLLGLLSILPLAGRRSQEAVSLSAAAAFADSVFNELLVRKPISNNLLSTMSGGTVTLPDAICIDPLYKGQQKYVAQVVEHYDDHFFPYVAAKHDPLIAPSYVRDWPIERPTMTRVGLRIGSLSDGRPDQGRFYAESSDDLSTVSETTN